MTGRSDIGRVGARPQGHQSTDAAPSGSRLAHALGRFAHTLETRWLDPGNRFGPPPPTSVAARNQRGRILLKLANLLRSSDWVVAAGVGPAVKLHNEGGNRVYLASTIFGVFSGEHANFPGKKIGPVRASANCFNRIEAGFPAISLTPGGEGLGIGGAIGHQKGWGQPSGPVSILGLGQALAIPHHPTMGGPVIGFYVQGSAAFLVAPEGVMLGIPVMTSEHANLIAVTQIQHPVLGLFIRPLVYWPLALALKMFKGITGTVALLQRDATVVSDRYMKFSLRLSARVLTMKLAARDFWTETKSELAPITRAGRALLVGADRLMSHTPPTRALSQLVKWLGKNTIASAKGLLQFRFAALAEPPKRPKP